MQKPSSEVTPEPPSDSSWPRYPRNSDREDMLGGFTPEEAAEMVVTIIRERNWFRGDFPNSSYWRLNNIGEVKMRFAYREAQRDKRRNYSNLYAYANGQTFLQKSLMPESLVVPSFSRSIVKKIYLT